MGCCIVAAIVLALSGRFTGRRRPDSDAGFAPVAVWPAEAAFIGTASVGAVRTPDVLSQRQAALGWFLRFAGCATFVYLVLNGCVAVDSIAGGADLGVWLVRTVALVVVGAVAALHGSRLLAHGRDTSTRSDIAGYCLVAAGLVALELMMLDMHVLKLYHLPHGNAHNMFQALCIVCIIAGGLLVADVRGRQPAISEIRGRT